jgi:hypothetical protein
MSDFINGVKDANDYLNRTKLEVLTGAIIDDTGTVTASTTSYSLKEIICSLLAGNGIKLPNLQVCLKINLARLIPELPAELAELRAALEDAEAALDEFIDHTNIDNVLNRLNAAIADFAVIANMINFCGTSVVPRAIPNVLRDLAGSFTETGKDLLDQLGEIADSDIGGCFGTSGGFNGGIFVGGSLKDLNDLLANIRNGTVNNLNSRIQSIKSKLNGFSQDMRNLIEFENNFASTDTKGGSTFTPSARVHKGVGLLVDPDTMTMQGANSLASKLQSAYDQLKAYEVDEKGNNIFHYILEPELISRLEDKQDPNPRVTERLPTYDYCGKIIGYTDVPLQLPNEISIGAPAETPSQPGATGIRESGIVTNTPPSTNTSLTNNSPVRDSFPETPIGKIGDKKGDLASDGSYLYYCVANYDGETNIWKRASLESSW